MYIKKRHSWVDGTCTQCGAKRAKVTIKKLTAVVKYYPYELYQQRVQWGYTLADGTTSMNAFDCPKNLMKN